jgi:hypothetical protein
LPTPLSVPTTPIRVNAIPVMDRVRVCVVDGSDRVF